MTYYIRFEEEGQTEISESEQARLREFWETNVPAFDRVVMPNLKDQIELSSPAYSESPGSNVDSLTATRLRKVMSFFIRYHDDLDEEHFEPLPGTKTERSEGDFPNSDDRRIRVRVGIFSR